MKKSLWVLALILTLWMPCRIVWGQNVAGACSVVTLNCDCTNPQRKFVVEDQRVGKVNPGDPGVCRSSLYIDDWVNENPYTACVRGGQLGFDPTKAPSCKATWTCKQPCSNPVGK